MYFEREQCVGTIIQVGAASALLQFVSEDKKANSDGKKIPTWGDFLLIKTGERVCLG